MSFRDIIITTISAFIFTPVVLLCVSMSNAQSMQSASYRIQSDSVNFGGGFSTSTNYNLESTGGEIATGESGSTNFKLKAGYQQMITSYIALSAPSSVTMAPSLSGIVGGESNGSTTVTVTTDNGAGYSLSISSIESPALRSGSNTIVDYSPVGAPDFTFTTGTGDAHFGYTPAGADVAQRFLDDGVSTCGSGSSETTLSCWDGLNIADETIAYRTSANTPAGSTTTVHFRVGIGSGAVVTAGTYTATTTLTALAL